jgi:hypothetical protein
VSNEDARQFVRILLARNPPVLFSQVVMNLPLDAAEFLGPDLLPSDWVSRDAEGCKASFLLLL